MSVSPFLKAVVGGLAAGLAALVAAASDGVVSPVEALTVLSALVGGFSAVYAVPNKPAAG